MTCNGSGWGLGGGGSHGTSRFRLQTRCNEKAVDGRNVYIQHLHVQEFQMPHLAAWPDVPGSRMIWQRGSPI